jgi:hypothetical protein
VAKDPDRPVCPRRGLGSVARRGHAEKSRGRTKGGNPALETPWSPTPDFPRSRKRDPDSVFGRPLTAKAARGPGVAIPRVQVNLVGQAPAGSIPQIGSCSPRIRLGWRAGSICMRTRATTRSTSVTRTGSVLRPRTRRAIPLKQTSVSPICPRPLPRVRLLRSSDQRLRVEEVLRTPSLLRSLE